MSISRVPKRIALRLAVMWPAALALATCAARADEAGGAFERDVKPFLEQHCIRCHGSETAEGDLRLDQLPAEIATSARVAEQWSEVMDRLNAGKMPPEDEPRPSIDAITLVTDWIAAGLRSAAEQGAGESVVLRRLNRAEYNNTIRDLVGVDFQPAADFPEDPPSHGFDNIGAALQVSPLLMEKYLSAAREIVDRAIVTGERPPRHSWHLEVEEAHRSNEFEGRRSAGRDEMWVPDPVTERHRYILKGGGSEVRDGFVVQRGAKDESPAGFRWFRIPQAGTYIIRIRAAARVPDREEVVASVRALRLARMEQKDWKDLGDAERNARRERWLAEEWPQIASHFETEPMYDFGAPRMKVTDDEGVVIGEVSVDALVDDPRIYEFSFEFEPDPRSTDGVNITNSYNVPSVLENFSFQREPGFARPELWIDWVELEGVVTDAWPPASHQQLLPDSPQRGSESQYAREVLSAFMPRAWRRPVTDDEVEQMAALFDAVRPVKRSLEEAIRIPLVAVLTSPHFLFLVEPGESDGLRPLTQYEIASRLSYFLWSSLPDDELFRLAEQNALTDREVMDRQVQRMLRDPKSDAFVASFVGQWLGLRELGANPPVETLFPRYDDHLEQSMRRESEAFFREVLDRDESVLNFLRSDFAMLNERMARFYGIPGVRGDEFRRVVLPANSPRGGLLGQASVLTLTSNGTRTSPVVRGKWILENVLGDPPPPPPPDAGDLAPMVPGIDKATVRDRLEAHRRIEQCAVCHRRIDPLGFALENFDAHGLWRDKYGFGYNGRVGNNDPDVDASGELPDGTQFVGVNGLAQVLLAREDHFRRCLVEKLMIYAYGRGLSFADRPERERIIAAMREDGDTLRGAIRAIVAGEAFLTK